ncbi:MAG TPA: amidinotransferase [Planctomycetes bacterium]|nr:amidinotransferase [Planctomycetota bacterium]|tara:strand:- start:144 stop:1040 length:897 start_codon:yes stop_codon:yes gene_type:complete
MAIFTSASDWSRQPTDYSQVDRPSRILLAEPTYFQVEEAQNAHMTAGDGSLQAVNQETAQLQWKAVKTAWQNAGFEVEALEGSPGLADLCFTANPTLILPLPGGGREGWRARMFWESRRPEADIHEAFFETKGIPIHSLPESAGYFEGGGDGLPHPGRQLLHGGFGNRTEFSAWEALAAARPDWDMLIYQQPNKNFYHLDTALAPLNEDTALFVPEAFDDDGLGLIHAAFPNAIPLCLEEAMNFAGNACCHDGKHVILQAGSPQTEANLQEHGFTPVPVETREFLKSGGSVRCLVQGF